MKIVIHFFCIIILAGCAASTGQVEIYSVNSKNKLDTPLHNASVLSNHQDVIQKTSDANALNGEDTFSIYMTDSYFRYLPDIGGVNEIIIVVEFTEAVTGTDKDTITKILGPYDSVADATKAPFFHKLIYGPKRMESDILSMSLKIFEYDLEEKKSAGTILDFISTSAEALSLANPVTIAEIKTVKEIAKAIINTNDNDLVFQIDMDFVAGNSLYNSVANKQVNVLPLKTGELVMIKQEVCSIGRCYDYFSNNEYIHANLVGYIADGLMLIPTAIVRGLADTPSSDALSDIDATTMEIVDAGIVHTTFWSKIPTAFKEKTWLRLSILKGGDPSLWAARKALYPSEKDLNDLLKSSGDIDVAAIEALGKSLQETKDKIANIKDGALGLSSVNTLNGTQFVMNDAATATLCLKVPSNITLKDGSQTYDNGTPTADGSPKSQQCYTLKSNDTSSKFVLGTKYFQVNYEKNQKLASLIVPVKTIDALSISNETTCKLDDEGATKLTFNVNHAESIVGLNINGNIKTPSIDAKKVTISLSSATDIVAVETVFKSYNITFSAPSNDCT